MLKPTVRPLHLGANPVKGDSELDYSKPQHDSRRLPLRGEVDK